MMFEEQEKRIEPTTIQHGASIVSGVFVADNATEQKKRIAVEMCTFDVAVVDSGGNTQSIAVLSARSMKFHGIVVW
jgi:hypothetical protein